MRVGIAELDAIITELKREQISLRSLDKTDTFEQEEINARCSSLYKELCAIAADSIQQLRRDDVTFTKQKFSIAMNEILLPVMDKYLGQLQALSNSDLQQEMEQRFYNTAEAVKGIAMYAFNCAAAYSLKDDDLIKDYIKNYRSGSRDGVYMDATSDIAKRLLQLKEGFKKRDDTYGISPFQRFEQAACAGLKDMLIEKVETSLEEEGKEKNSKTFCEDARRRAEFVLKKAQQKYNFDPSLLKEIGM